MAPRPPGACHGPHIVQLIPRAAAHQLSAPHNFKNAKMKRSSDKSAGHGQCGWCGVNEHHSAPPHRVDYPPRPSLPTLPWTAHPFTRRRAAGHTASLARAKNGRHEKSASRCCGCVGETPRALRVRRAGRRRGDHPRPARRVLRPRGVLQRHRLHQAGLRGGVAPASGVARGCFWEWNDVFFADPTNGLIHLSLRRDTRAACGSRLS